MAQQSDSQVTNVDSQSPSTTARASSNTDSLKDMGADMAAPYETRSRNRGGRINYAEDKDIDMDVYDFYDRKDQDSSKKLSRKSDVGTNGDNTPRSVAWRKGSATEDAKAAVASHNGSKDSTPGLSTSASQSAAPPAGAPPGTRKRKAATTTTPAAPMKKAAQTGQTGQTGQAAQAAQAVQVSGTAAWPDSNMLTFENCNHRVDANGRMVADDGTVLEPDDHVYLVCEPPGEPYYLGRIMEFVHSPGDSDDSKRVQSVRINWFYRPKDIGRKTTDTRLVFATMHSDVSPLTALRGKCWIRHRVEVDNLEAFRKTPDCFWYEKLYDRYIQKNYDLLPTSTIVNVPDRVKKVLDERWKFVLVEQGRGKELTSAVKLCKRCTGYCASNDSVDCAVCQNTYHMNCVKPPLLKKPSRGFAWSCAACSRAQERRLEAHNAPNGAEADDDDLLDDDDDDTHGIDTDRTTPAEDEEHHQGTPEQIYQASLWPWRYLGMHCKPEDALDYDDRIHPRASTRIGPRHQANVCAWPGRPVEYVKPMETRKGRGVSKLSKEAQMAQEAERAARHKRPKWVQDEPPGYQARGEDVDENSPDSTSTRLWVPPPPAETASRDRVVAYMAKAQAMARKLGLPEHSTNLQDVALETLFRNNHDPAAALKHLAHTEPSAFKEPSLTPAEQKKFEEGVAKYGSELHLVMKHVKTMTPGEVVRYYYTWKKTERGKQVWGSYSGRKGKRLAKKEDTAASKAADDVADGDDDSAFDSKKAVDKKRSFVCQFCSTTTSRQWRRAPTAQGLVNENGSKATGKEKGSQYVVALCRRCAELWRRYAIRWEDMDEVAKKVSQSGGKAWKRKQDEELLKELQAAQEMGFMTPDHGSPPAAAAAAPPTTNGQEPPRKKLKGAPEKDTDTTASDTGSTTASTRKKEKTADSTPAPDMPKPRTLPCAICNQMEPLGDQHLSCRECRLTVHRNCYGVIDHRMQGKWVCDMCSNDKSPQVSIHYKCILCPIEVTEQDFVEQPKLTHHKKKMSDKDRERERMEVQQARKAAEYYRKRQEDLNRPVNPREPLKRTADNNWVHVTCAVWTPEVKFGSARALEPCEGIPSIARAKYDEVCHACNQQGDHVECARQQGHVLGFDIAPVKSSRRDYAHIVTMNGESGIMSAVMWCKDHIPTRTIAHQMHEVVHQESGLTALQLYVQNYKQADLSLTGSVRKANLMLSATRMSASSPVPPGGARRTSSTGTATILADAATNATTTSVPNGVSLCTENGDAVEVKEAAANPQQPGSKVCIRCGIDVTPKWWPIDDSQRRRLTNGHQETIGSEARKFVEQRKFQCHKCKTDPKTSASFMTRAAPAPAPTPTPASTPAPAPAPAPASVSTPAPATALPALASESPRKHLPVLNAAGPPPLRSPPPRAPPSEFRATSLRPEIQSLLHPPTTAAAATAHVPGPVPGPVPGAVPAPTLPRPSLGPSHGSSHGPAPIGHSPLSQPRALGPRHPTPTPISHGYGQAPPPPPPPPSRSAYGDWGSPHGSPPRHMNGAPPPPMHGGGGGPSSVSGLTALRPPSMSGPPPPVAPMSVSLSHPRGSPIYGSTMPLSPRRISGPAPPLGYVPPYAGAPPQARASNGRHSASPHSAHGALPPRSDAYSHGPPPQRPAYAGELHTSPPLGRNGLPRPGGPPPLAPPHELATPGGGSLGSLGHRSSERRPEDNASANPSLRNLLWADPGCGRE
ncbi:hypothetical protein E4U53_004691 [Claviceps sorghi]|nr:hypothetical protein E4U53_004691 [Claviceps sorghi]